MDILKIKPGTVIVVLTTSNTKFVGVFIQDSNSENPRILLGKSTVLEKVNEQEYILTAACPCIHPEFDNPLGTLLFHPATVACMYPPSKHLHDKYLEYSGFIDAPTTTFVENVTNTLQ